MRGFFGGFGANGKDGGKKTVRASDIAKQSMLKGGSIKNMSQDEMFQEILQQKMNAKKKELGYGSANKFSLPGTDPNQTKQPSKAAMAALNIIAEKQAKKEMKKKAQEVTVSARFINTPNGGGRIDAKGNIRDARGNVILKIDQKTGKVKTLMGLPTGVMYDPQNSGQMFQLEQMVRQHNDQRYNTANRAQGAIHTPPGGGTGWNGGGSTPAGGGSSWNGGAWDPNKKDDKGWW